MLVHVTSGFVAPTKKAWRKLRVAESGAEHSAPPVGTASLHSGSVAAAPAAAKATPAPAAPAPKAEAPPAAPTLEGDAAEHAIRSPTSLDPNAFAGAAALAAGAVGLGVDVELATVAAGAAAVVSALDEESSVGQLTRSLGRLALSTFEGAKRFDAEVGVTDAIKGKALALAIDATEAAADAPAKLRKPARDEPKTLYTPLWQPPKDGAPVGAGEPAWAHKAEQRREELAALAAAKAAAEEAARLAAVAAIPVTSREILAAREESGAVATLGRLAGRWLWRRDARKKAMRAEEKQRS